MDKPARISIDAMGGDHGPSVVVAGCAMAAERHRDLEFLLYGDETQVRAELGKFPVLAERAKVIHCEVAIKMSEKPSQALRHGRRVSSMWRAIEAVKSGDADATVSAGNTGALMAMAKVCLHTMEGIDRPALAARWPNVRGDSIVLDLGASIGADAQHLVDLAIMGAAMARIIKGVKEPRVGLLNVGVEEIKGIEEVKAAGRILRNAKLPNLKYHGFVEGDDLGLGTVDVFVTEGFTGNIALKTAEGTAKQIADYLRTAMRSSLMSRIGYFFARGAFRELRNRMDPRQANGGVFLGLNGICIKSHGGTDALGFCGAIEIGYEMIRHELQANIRDMLVGSQDSRDVAAQPAPGPEGRNHAGQASLGEG